LARIKINLPEIFIFSTEIDVRITDMNYGGHLGNDALLSLLHEARVRFLKSLGQTELNFYGVSLIMADAGIVYKTEVFYGDNLVIEMTAGDITSHGFDLIYCVRKGNQESAALAKTAMLAFNYETRKIESLPESFLQQLKGMGV
jgi:acyl-CoA thioester hydrolase